MKDLADYATAVSEQKQQIHAQQRASLKKALEEGKKISDDNVAGAKAFWQSQLDTARGTKKALEEEL